MADTFFSPGTVITHDWLNDVNDTVYNDLGGPGIVGTSAGGNHIGYNPTATYNINTIGQSVQDGCVNVMWFLTEAERAQVKANGTAIDLTSKINAAKTWGGDRPLYLPAGTWSITTLSFIGNKGGIIGDGIDVTILKVRSVNATVIDLNETVDTNPNAGIFKNFTLDGNGVGGTGFNVRYRHQIKFENLYVTNFTASGIATKDTYLSRADNVRLHLCDIGLWLKGSNHSSSFVGCTFDGSQTGQIKIESLGTPLDGNHSLSFTGCDIEFGSGVSYGADITATSVTFNGCFLGDGMTGPVIIARQGLVEIIGGSLFYGNTTAVIGIVMAGATARVAVDRVSLNGQTNPNIAYLLSQTSDFLGQAIFTKCNLNGTVTGTPIFLGDPVGYGPQGTVYASRLGKNWTGEGNNITFSSTVINNSQKFIVLTAPGPTPLLGAKVNLASNSLWRDGENLFLIVVYESTKAADVKLSGGGFGTAPTINLLSTLPIANGGNKVTAVGVQIPASSAAYTILEVVQQSSAVNDYLIIHEVILADSRMLDPGGSSLGNLYKC
jgi:hypothetical protein